MIRVTHFGATADASKMSGLEFFDALGFSSPEIRAKRAEEGRKAAARQGEKNRREILAMRERIAELLSPEKAARAREEWATQDALRAGELGLVEVEHLGPGRIAA